MRVSFLTYLQCIAGQCLIIPEVHYGAGRHIDQILPKDFQESFKLNFITQPIYLVAIVLVKESIGCFLLRIAIIPAYRRSIIGIMGKFLLILINTPLILPSLHGTLHYRLFLRESHDISH